MTIADKLESLMQQLADLPAEAQADFFQTLIEMRSQHLGVYNPEQETA